MVRRVFQQMRIEDLSHLCTVLETLEHHLEKGNPLNNTMVRLRGRRPADLMEQMQRQQQSVVFICRGSARLYLPLSLPAANALRIGQQWPSQTYQRMSVAEGSRLLAVVRKDLL